MRKINGYGRETLAEAGLKIVRETYDELVTEDEEGKRETWGRSPHFAGYALEHNGVTWEFVSSTNLGG